MRLNFSGSGEDEIREGVRRIGRVVSEQVELYETITREQLLGDEGEDGEQDTGGDVVPMRRRKRSP